jgi:hypothetical protein
VIEADEPGHVFAVSVDELAIGEEDLAAGKARRAAVTAASTSAAPPRGTRAIIAPVEGSNTGAVASAGTSIECPSIQ